MDYLTFCLILVQVYNIPHKKEIISYGGKQMLNRMSETKGFNFIFGKTCIWKVKNQQNTFYELIYNQ